MVIVYKIMIFLPLHGYPTNQHYLFDLPFPIVPLCHLCHKPGDSTCVSLLLDWTLPLGYLSIYMAIPYYPICYSSIWWCKFSRFLLHDWLGLTLHLNLHFICCLLAIHIFVFCELALQVFWKSAGCTLYTGEHQIFLY